MNENNVITDLQENKNGSTAKTNPLKILVKKVVFLDLSNSYELFKALKECLNLVEAKIADCLSKEVNYLITNRAATTTNDRDTSHKRFKTSPNAQMNFMHAKSLINRTHSILERASKANVSTSIDAVSTATRLGIKVINVSELEPYLQKFNRKSANHAKDINSNKHETSKRESLENKKTNILKLKSPFIKFESICKQYKPVYCEFKIWHDIDFESVVKNTCSPFQNYFSDDNKGSSIDSNSTPSQSNTANTVHSTLAQSTSIGTLNNINKSSKSNLIDGITRKTSNSVLLPKKENKKKTGYCECCKQRYDNLKQHITSAQHENFEKNFENFKEIDQLINGELNFDTFLIKNNLRNSNKLVEFAEPNAVENKDINVSNSIESKLPESNEFQFNNDLQNEANESSKINLINETNKISILEEPKKTVQNFDSEIYEPTDAGFNNKTDDLENQLHISPIKKNSVITASSLINQLMKSPVPLNVLEEQAATNQIIKLSPAKLNSFQSPLSRIMVNHYEESSSFNCIDDVVLAAFINDFSYELVENQSFNQNR